MAVLVRGKGGWGRTLDAQQLPHSMSPIYLRPAESKVLGAGGRLLGTLSSEQTPEQTRWWGGWQAPLPVISLFAKLLLEVAQGQALSLQHPPVWNFFSTEKVGNNQLAGLECVNTSQFLWLFVTEKETRMPQTQPHKADTH